MERTVADMEIYTWIGFFSWIAKKNGGPWIPNAQERVKSPLQKGAGTLCWLRDSEPRAQSKLFPVIGRLLGAPPCALLFSIPVGQKASDKKNLGDIFHTLPHFHSKMPWIIPVPFSMI